MAVAAAGIIGLLGALDGEHEGDVAQLLDLLHDFLGEERGVGVQREEAVVVLLGEFEDILHADRRLTAGHHVQVDAEFLALGDDLVHVLIGEVALVSVGAAPAADAVHVAGHRGIEEDQPRDVAAVLLTVCADGLGAAKEGLIAEVQEHLLGIAGIRLIDDPVQVLRPLVIRIGEILLDRVEGGLIVLVAEEALCEVDELTEGLGPVVCLADVLPETVDDCRDGLALRCMCQILNCSCHIL